MRTLVRVFLGLLVLAVAVVGTVVLTFDPESYKAEIVDAVKRATGRDLRIAGPIRLALSVSPTIEIVDVTLSNPPGFSRPAMASVGKVDLRVALMPLLSKRIEIERLILTKPDVRLETDAKGTPNWVFTPLRPAEPSGGTAAPAGSGGKKEPVALLVRDLRLDDGTFTYRNGRTGQLDTVAAKRVETSFLAADAPLHVTAAFSLDGSEVTVTADTGPLTQLTGASFGGPWPVKLAVTVAGAKFGLDGTIADPVARTGLAFVLTANMPDLAALGAALKADLPVIKSLVFSAKLFGDPRKILLSDLKIASSAGDLAGDLAVTMPFGGLPLGLTGTLKSEKLDLDALAAPHAAAAKPAPVAGGPAAPAATRPRWLIPDGTLPVGQLQMVNADLHIAIGAVHVRAVDYNTIQAHVLLKDGVLTLDPASADLPGGHVALTLSADAGKTAPPVHLTLRAPGIALAPLLAALNEPPYATGNLEVTADLHGAGESPHAIAASLEGTLALVLPSGTIDIERIGGASAGVMRALNPKAGSGAVELRCFALRVDFSHGVGSARALTLGSGLLNVDGSGSFDLTDETLALVLRSHVTLAGAAVTVPVKVFGPLAAPQTRVDRIGIAESNAVLLGSLLGKPAGSAIGDGQKPAVLDSCPAALAVARGEGPPAEAAPAAPAPAPAAPAPAPAKPPNAGQMLQKLFH
jgi:uncharacterized protein involved in outer membrane biogenesis